MGQHATTTDSRPPHLGRGLAVAVVLGPLVILGALLVLVAVLSMFLSGLDPRAWFSGSGADWLFGGGVAGDAVNYVRFMVGAGLVAGGSAGIRWGFYGDQR